MGFWDPELASDLLAEFVPKEKREEVRVIDFGCGSGIMGKYAKEKHGFKHIDGVDASEKMLEKAAEKNAYEDLKHFYVGCGEMPEKYVGAYDYASSTGSFLPKHIPCTGIADIVAAVKKDGFIIISFRDMYLNDPEMGHQVFIDKLIAEGKIALHKKMTWMKYKEFTDSNVPIYNPGTSHMLIFKKL